MATRRSEKTPSRRQPPAVPKAGTSAASGPSRSRGASARAAAAPVPATAPTAAPRRARARPSAPPSAEALQACLPSAEETAQAQSFWRAGLRALDNVRHDVQRRQASVIETLLGIPPAAAGAEPRLGLPGLPGLDAFGLRKFEDVFDQRVAAALERLGMPTREELQALHDKLDRVLAQLERIGAQAEAAKAATPAQPPGNAARPRKPR